MVETQAHVNHTSGRNTISKGDRDPHQYGVLCEFLVAVRRVLLLEGIGKICDGRAPKLIRECADEDVTVVFAVVVGKLVALVCGPGREAQVS